MPSGGSLGRNLRSKTRWFTGFCNSHHVSHFATFFIDARAEISVAESRIFLLALATDRTLERLAGASAFIVFLGVIPRRIPTSNQRAPKGAREEAGGAEEAASASAAAFCHVFDGRVFGKATTMILPQVHLRKPCYDFSFL